MLLADRELTARAAKIEAVLDDIEALPDPATRARVAEIVQGLLVLYGEGLARMLAIVRQQGDHRAGDEIVEAFAGDELIAHLLLLHDLHPVDLETRVARALDDVRPYLQSHGGNVELIAIDGGVARLRLQGSCHGCPSSTMTLKLAIEEAIQKVAPDLDGIEAEGAVEPPPQPAGFVPMSALRKPAAGPVRQTPAADGPAWIEVDPLPHLTGGGMAALEVAGLPLLFVKLADDIYAYHDACPGCGHSLGQGTLARAELSCPTCAHRYEVRRAGRCPDAPHLHLEPIPLLVKDGIVTVALAQAATRERLAATH